MTETTHQFQSVSNNRSKFYLSRIHLQILNKKILFE